MDWYDEDDSDRTPSVSSEQIRAQQLSEAISRGAENAKNAPAADHGNVDQNSDIETNRMVEANVSPRKHSGILGTFFKTRDSKTSTGSNDLVAAPITYLGPKRAASPHPVEERADEKEDDDEKQDSGPIPAAPTRKRSVIINIQDIPAEYIPDEDKPAAPDSDDDPDDEEEDYDEVGMEKDKRHSGLSRTIGMEQLFQQWDRGYYEEENDTNTDTETTTLTRMNTSAYIRQLKAENEEKHHLEEEYANEKVITHTERIKAEAVFDFCVEENEDHFMTEDQFYKGLSLLGFVEKSERVRTLWLRSKKNSIDKKNFVLLLIQLREKKDEKQTDNNKNKDEDVPPEDDIFTRIEEHFEALYEGTCEFDDQRDESGKKYILASELRRILTTLGQKLTDEEADELLRECTKNNSDRIFLEQYRAMLLNSTV